MYVESNHSLTTLGVKEASRDLVFLFVQALCQPGVSIPRPRTGNEELVDHTGQTAPESLKQCFTWLDQVRREQACGLLGKPGTDRVVVCIAGNVGTVPTVDRQDDEESSNVQA